MHRLYAGLSWLLLCLIVVSLAPLAHAGPSLSLWWSEPLPLSETGTGAVASVPDLAVDDEGRVHVLWYSVLERPPEQGGGLRDVLVYRAQAGGVWSSPEPIYFRDRPAFSDTSSPLSSDAAARNPAFALQGSASIGRDGRLHLTAGDRVEQWYAGVPWHDVVRMALLLPPVALGEGTYSALAAGDAGTLTAVLTAVPDGIEATIPDGSTTCGACVEVLFRRSSDGGITWSRPENLSRLEGPDSAPQIGTDAKERVHVLWEHLDSAQGDGQSGAPYYLLYRRSDDGGQRWAEPVRLGAPGEGSLQATLGVGAGDRLVVVYGGTSTGSIFYQTSDDGGQSWSPPGLVPGVVSPGLSATSGRRFALAADGNGHLHLLMVGALPADGSSGLRPIHLSWDGQRWSPPTLVGGGGPAPESPRLVVERGNILHAVWSTTATDPDGVFQQQTIWYSSAPVAAPARTPLPTFTPMAAVVPTASPTAIPIPTATLLPAERRGQATVEGPPRWEGEGLQVLLIALGPVVLLLGGVLWWATRRS